LEDTNFIVQSFDKTVLNLVFGSAAGSITVAVTLDHLGKSLVGRKAPP
jgi:hypothetical protein